MEITIVTNNIPRDVQYWWDLTKKVQDDDFYYIDGWKVENGEMSPEFVKYKGEWYDLGDMMSTRDMPHLAEWDMYLPMTYFFGTMFRYFRDPDNNGEIDVERVICGSFHVN